MPTKRELRNLADRAEAANLNDESQMMQEVGTALGGGGTLFIALEYGPAVDEGDYCRAAKILVRDGYEWCEGQAGAQVLAFSEIDKPPHKPSASTPALSLTAAYLRALAGKAFNQTSTRFAQWPWTTFWDGGNARSGCSTRRAVNQAIIQRNGRLI